MNKLTANEIAQIIIIENIKIGQTIYSITPFSRFVLKEYKFITTEIVRYDNLVDIALLWNVKYFPSREAAQSALEAINSITKIKDDTECHLEFENWKDEQQGKILDKLI